MRTLKVYSPQIVLLLWALAVLVAGPTGTVMVAGMTSTIVAVAVSATELAERYREGHHGRNPHP